MIKVHFCTDTNESYDVSLMSRRTVHVSATQPDLSPLLHAIFSYVKRWSTARHAIHLRFDISSNSLGIRAVQSPKCLAGCAVDCTF
jgi:hypothetical protein